MTGMLAIWDLLSHVFLYWLGTVGVIVITILVLMGISMSFDTLSWTWRRVGEAAVTAEAAAAAAEETACVGDDESDEASAATATATAAGAAAGAERGKGAKWKKSSQRAAERREREAQSGRATPPFPLLFTKRPRVDAPDKDDPEATYAAAFSASLKHLASCDLDAESNDDKSAPGGWGVGGATDCADIDTEWLRSRSVNSSSGELNAASEGEGRAPAGEEVAPDAPAAREHRGVNDLPADTAAAGRAPHAIAGLTFPAVGAARKASEKAAASSDPRNMQVALLPNTKRNSYSARSLSDASFHAAAHGDIRRLLSPYSSLLDDDRWEKMGLVSVPKNRLMKSSLLPNFRYFSHITQNKAMITTCLATMHKLKQNNSEQKFNSITARKRKNITHLPSEFSPDSTREEGDKCSKALNETSDGEKQTSQIETMHEESSTELLKRELQAWNCVPPAEIRSPSQTTVLSTLTEVSEMGSTNDLKPFEVKAGGKGSFVSSKPSKASAAGGNKATFVNQGKSNTRPKSANNPSKPNSPSKSSPINPAKPNTPPRSPPASAKKPPNANTTAKGGKVQSNIFGSASNFPKNPNPKISIAKVPNTRSTGGNPPTPKPITPQGSPTKNPAPRGAQGRMRR